MFVCNMRLVFLSVLLACVSTIKPMNNFFTDELCVPTHHQCINYTHDQAQVTCTTVAGAFGDGYGNVSTYDYCPGHPFILQKEVCVATGVIVATVRLANRVLPRGGIKKLLCGTMGILVGGSYINFVLDTYYRKQ